MSETDRKTMGVVGVGSFGTLVLPDLARRFRVVATDRRDLRETAEAAGATWGSLADVAACDVVVVAVPIRQFRSVLQALAPDLASGTLVADVASVKAAPVQWMLRELPDDVEIVGTHPLFGPRSAADGLAGHRIVLCPARTERLGRVRRFLEDQLGLRVTTMDPEAHDRLVATPQALAHLVGRAVAELELPEPPASTPSYRKLVTLATDVAEDSRELFEAIQTLNPWAAESRKRLVAILQDLDRRFDAAERESREEEAAGASPSSSPDPDRTDPSGEG